MARSSSQDPIEKFRFKVEIFSIDLLATGDFSQSAANAAFSGLRNLVVPTLTRAGFSEIVLPEVTVNTMSYRENIDNQRFSKGPGLVKYDPVVLRRGATESRDLYEWYRLVNNDTLLLGAAQEIGGDATVPGQSENFRKEVLITSIDREGNTVKQWMLFNAYPAKYKGGNDLNAQSEEKLVEELTIEYEFFLELDSGGLAVELAKDAAIAGANTVANVAAKANLPFTR